MVAMNGRDDVRYHPKPLCEPPAVEAVALVEAGRQDRLVLYLGAGVSIPSPACGPRGNQVADRLRPVVAEMLGVGVSELIEPDLESLAARLERDAADRLAQLKYRAAGVWDFREMQPNYAHEVVALLLREGLVRVVSANWDCAVENGGLGMAIKIEGVSRGTDMLNLPVGALPCYKVHGCARRPPTLVLTRAEVDDPERWARAEVEGAITSGTVVFVGLGTVGSYVSESVQELLDLWTDVATTVRVVDPDGPSEAWTAVLQDRAEEVGVAMGADEFLDDLLRGAVTEALSRVAQASHELHSHEQAPWSAAIVDGHEALRNALLQSRGDAVLRWWRDGVVASEHGRQFIFSPAGQVALMCVSQLAWVDGGELAASGSEGQLAVRSGSRYFEIACRPQAHWTEVARAAQVRIERRRSGGCYAAGAPVTVVIHGATGGFPDPAAPVDIAAETAEGSGVAAGDADAVLFVRAEDAMNGVLAA
jgi:hypothetical protein